MGTVIDIESRRTRRATGRPLGHGGQFVECENCGESHPVVRLAGGEERCLTAFHDGRKWFCKNRGCRQAWLKPLQSS